MTAKKIAMSGLMLALALIISLIENMIPPIIPALPYVKIGLGNIVLLLTFILIGAKEGYIILILRCVLTAVFSGNMSMLMWSLPAGFVAYTIMILLYKTNFFSTIGISMAGGIIHNVMQILVATLIVGDSVYVYLPYMILAGGIAGFITGLICHFFVVRFKDNFVDFKLKYIEYHRENN